MPSPSLVDDALRYVVPPGVTGQPLYFRGGNTSDELICIVLLRDGSPMRYFPIGAKGRRASFPLRVVEDLDGGTTLELQVAAPEGLSALSSSTSGWWRSDDCPGPPDRPDRG